VQLHCAVASSSIAIPIALEAAHDAARRVIPAAKQAQLGWRLLAAAGASGPYARAELTGHFSGAPSRLRSPLGRLKTPELPQDSGAFMPELVRGVSVVLRSSLPTYLRRCFTSYV